MSKTVNVVKNCVFVYMNRFTCNWKQIYSQLYVTTKPNGQQRYLTPFPPPPSSLKVSNLPRKMIESKHLVICTSTLQVIVPYKVLKILHRVFRVVALKKSTNSPCVHDMLHALTACTKQFCDAITSHRTFRGLRASVLNLSLHLNCDYVLYMNAPTELSVFRK